LETYKILGAEGQAAGSAPVLVERRLTSLDGWRGVAILLVFFRHYSNTTSFKHGWVMVLSRVLESGWIGVDLFFVLSGFLITGILLDTREHKNYFKNFYARRTLRIFPLYFGVLFALLAATPWLHLQWTAWHLSFFFYVSNIASQFKDNLYSLSTFVGLGPTWSLCVEEQFYMLWPLVILLIPNRKRLLQFIVGAMTLALLTRLALLLVLPNEPAYEWAYHVLPMRADGLLCGAMIAVLYRKNISVKQLRWPLGIAAVVFAAVCISCGYIDFHSVATCLLIYPSVALLFGGLLLHALQQGTWANWIGNVGWLRFFGRYSYGMYIFHDLLNTAGLMRWMQMKMHSLALGGMVYVVMMLAITTVVSVLSYELFEKQFLKLKDRFSYSAI